MSQTIKETKAQRAERLKGQLNPWSAYAEIERFAREGWESIPPEWLNTYFRWWGIYTQGDGVGAVGGVGGEGKSVRHLLVRIRIPNGVLTSRQASRIADLAERFARGVADLTCARTYSSTGYGSRISPPSSRACRRSASAPWDPVATSPGTSPVVRWRAWTPTRLPTPRRSSRPPPPCSTAARSSTTCRASSRCPSPAAASGARTRRSTMSV
jgi:Sulfite reductase, beta subunit (hemoprotein)